MAAVVVVAGLFKSTADASIYTLTDLGFQLQLGGSPVINNAGQIAGNRVVDSQGQGLLWENGVITNLGTLPGEQQSAPDDINDAGQIVGSFGATPRQRFESDEHTLALYHFDSGRGNILRDSSGNGHHGIIYGATWVRRGKSQRLSANSEVPNGQRDKEPKISKIIDSSESKQTDRTTIASAAAPTFNVAVLDRGGQPLADVNCRLVVGGYPSGEKGLPTRPSPDNDLVANTNGNGIVTFKHAGLDSEKRHLLYVDKVGFCSAFRNLAKADIDKRTVSIVLFEKRYVTIRYVFQPAASRSLAGEGTIEGKVKLHPKQGGSYRPPARAHFSFHQNLRVGSGGLLKASEPGIEIDQIDGKLYFSGSKGRFDHCTDLGPIEFDSVKSVETDALDRKREDSEMQLGHVYIYESNIYEPQRRTKFTGHEVRYAKILVESIDAADTEPELSFEPAALAPGRRVRVSFRPGSNGLDGARTIHAYWAAYSASGDSLVEPKSGANQGEFPARPRGSVGGDFELGRKRCVVQKMETQDDLSWTCEIQLPQNAASLAIVFVDDLGRTSLEGIRRIPVDLVSQ